MDKDQFLILSIMVAGFIFISIKYIRYKNNNRNNLNYKEREKYDFKPTKHQNIQLYKNAINEKKIHRYNLCWFNLENRIYPSILNDEELKRFNKLSPFFEHDTTQVVAGLLFTYGSQNYKDDIKNEDIEMTIANLAIQTKSRDESRKNDKIDTVIQYHCEEAREDCSLIYGDKFMLIFSIGGFKLTRNRIHLKNATVAFYNLIKLELPLRSTKLGHTNDLSILWSTENFEIDIIQNKFRVKDKNMEHPVNVVINESLKVGLSDFNSNEIDILIDGLKLFLVLKFETDS